MYTKEQVDEMLSEVENEINIAFETMNKSEEIEAEEVETEVSAEESLEKNEEIEADEAGEEEYETIDELYNSMTKSEKEAHYASVKKSLFGEEVDEDLEKDEDMSPHAQEQAAKAAQKKLAQDNIKAGKVNQAYDKAVAHDDDLEYAREKRKQQNRKAKKVEKSEETEGDVTEMLKSENEELKKSLDQLNGLLDKVFNREKSAPKGKALTGYDVINKSEESNEKEDVISNLSKSEITKKLNQIDYSDLSKSDRDAINEYCLENGSVDKIKHLIKE